MIIKCEYAVGGKAWRYYEADKVFSSPIPPEEWDGKLYHGEGIYEEAFLIGDNVNCRFDDLVLISFLDKNEDKNNIYTQFRVYLLNDSGKTIDRLS